MVLVTEAERLRGHARALMHRAMQHIAATGTVAGLDATPAGLPLYRSLGFEDGATLMRMGRLLPSPSRGGAGGGVRLTSAADLPRICSYDMEAFGADRALVLHDLHARRPEAAFFAHAGGRTSGFVLARPGRLASQIGPLVADDDETADRLLRAALAALSGPVIVDVFTHRQAVCELLGNLGFTAQRPFTRMLTGASPLPETRTVLSAGPELG
jgi:hypothetical protein